MLKTFQIDLYSKKLENNFQKKKFKTIVQNYFKKQLATCSRFFNTSPQKFKENIIQNEFC